MVINIGTKVDLKKYIWGFYGTIGSVVKDTLQVVFEIYYFTVY